MYEPNIYVNNSKINLYQLSIMSVFFNYLRTVGALFIPPKICPGLTVFKRLRSETSLIDVLR